MNTIFTFVRAPGATALLNLSRFISLSRDDILVFGAIDFDADKWNVGTSLNTGTARGTDSIYFCTLSTANGKSQSVKFPLDPQFAPFAKAYIRYMQGIKPVGNSGTCSRMRALQAIEQALLESGKACPTRINSLMLDRAAAIVKSMYASVGVAYHIGSAMGCLSRFLDENRLTRVLCNWRNHLGAPSDFRVKVGPEFESRRNAKLPIKENLEAIGIAFHRATLPRDVLVSSVLGLLLCQPGRLIEILLLPINCLVPRGDGKRGFLLRYRAAKGGGQVLKPVTETMCDIAEEAINRLTRLSEPARLVAEHYELYPNRIYLPKKLEHLRNNVLLSSREVGEILWGDAFRCNGRTNDYSDERTMLASVLTWCKTNKVTVNGDLRAAGNRKCSAINTPRIKMADLERTILNMLPRGFPILNTSSGIRYSEALCISRVSEYGFVKRVLVCMIRPIGKQEITKAVDETSDSGIPSLFESTGVRDNEGRPIKIESHQLRHFLNTVAHSASMDKFDIAAWSGRKDVSQNSAYDHVSNSERVEEMRDSVENATSNFAPTMQKKSYIPIFRSEWLTNRVRAGHTTDLGHCVHDFIMAPCSKFGDHISCDEHIVVKGNADVEIRVRQSLKENQILYDSAASAVSGGNSSAKNWLDTHKSHLNRLKEIVQILDDPNIKKGALIRLSSLDSSSRLSDANTSRRILESQTGKQGENSQKTLMSNGVPAPASDVPGLNNDIKSTRNARLTLSVLGEFDALNAPKKSEKYD